MPKLYIRLRGVGPRWEDEKWESDCLLRIGRLPGMEIQLNASSISRCHAEVAHTDEGWVVRDLGSTNGTFLNGVRVGRSDRKLRLRDLLQCGNVVLLLEALGEEALDSSETSVGTMRVQATTEQSLEQAVQLLAMDVTRRTRPGEQLLPLLRAGQHLYQISSLDDLLRLSLGDAIAALNAQRGAILLSDEATGKLALRAVVMAIAEPEGVRSYSATLAQRCYRSGQSLLCSDVQSDPELLRAQSVTAGAMSSLICALLRSPRKRLGVLHLDRGPFQDPFTRQDLELADAIAANMSAGIESALLMQEKQKNIFVQTVIALAQAIELRDQYTGGHTQRVTDYSLLLAEHLKLSAADRHALRVGAPLHDIGKIGIDDAILRKRGRLTPDEYEQMKSHTVKGAMILGTIAELDFIIPIVRNHHERWDGKGYPDGLTGVETPRLARLVAVTDTFDALTTDRPYRAGMPLRHAFAQIEQAAGSQLDPECATAFLELRPQLEELLQQHGALAETATMGQLQEMRLLAAGTALV